ncbi:MAG: toll/interleukin-1 receptor domain-containing protein [Acidobacteria bacterium]|nr:toll/interleukin-1 receptor domain-containing protein [Acidobacteriota bacterium]
MAETYFFLSYASANTDPHLERFFKDLSHEVALLEPGVTGFMDKESIPAGKDWRPEVERALSECRVFLSVYSPAYFISEYCGKEWQAFRGRQDAYVGGLPADAPDDPRRNPGLSVPILWTSREALQGRVPAVLPDIQDTEGAFGPEYVGLGLRQLIINDMYKDQYHTFVNRLAKRLVDAARANPLKKAAGLPKLEDIENPFVERRPAHLPLPPVSGFGRQTVYFVLVAATRDEIEQARMEAALDAYGKDGGLSWKPYWKDAEVEFGLEAQGLASQWQLYSYAYPVRDDLLDLIKDAARNNNIVVIVADAWTLKLDPYRNLLNAWQGLAFYNCVLLVPWGSDDKTQQARPLLIDNLAQTFPTRIVVDPADPERRITSLDQFCVMDGINKRDDLLEVLRESLASVRARIAMVTPYVNPAGPGQRPPSVL